MANKLSKKVLTLEKPARGSYEPNLAPKSKPNTFTQPNDDITELALDTITESTLNAGVTVDGVLLKDGDITVDGISVETITATTAVLTDIISEENAGSGVTIDGVKLQDGLLVRKVAYVTTTGVTQTFNCGANNVIFITTTTGTDIAKLSNSVITDGHEITLVHAVDGGELILSKLNAGDGVGFTTVTFTNAGDTATFVWSNIAQAWFIVALNGAVAA
jgi:hypothetical protein